MFLLVKISSWVSRNSMMPPEVGQVDKEMVLGHLFCHGWLIETVRKLQALCGERKLDKFNDIF